MTPCHLNLVLAVLAVFWSFMHPESLMDLGARLDAYITLGYKWAKIIPAYVRMQITLYLMARKMRRELGIAIKSRTSN
jgi:hypothetical protein